VPARAAAVATVRPRTHDGWAAIAAGLALLVAVGGAVALAARSGRSS